MRTMMRITLLTKMRLKSLKSKRKRGQRIKRDLYKLAILLIMMRFNNPLRRRKVRMMNGRMMMTLRKKAKWERSTRFRILLTMMTGRSPMVLKVKESRSLERELGAAAITKDDDLIKFLFINNKMRA